MAQQNRTCPVSTSFHPCPRSFGSVSYVAMSCGVGHRLACPVSLGPWCGPAAAAPIRPLAWERPFPVGEVLNSE